MTENENKTILIGSGAMSSLSDDIKDKIEKGDIIVVDPEEVSEDFVLHNPRRRSRLEQIAAMGMMLTPELDMYDTRIYEDDWNKLSKSDRRGTPAAVRNSKEDPKIQRNEPCPCGSGKKYKKCCMDKK